MLRDSLSLRSINIAYLFPAQPVLKREEALDFYDKVTAAGVEVSQFAYQPTAVQFQGAKQSRPPDVLNVVVDHQGPQLRLHVWEDFPTRPLNTFSEQADEVWEAFGKVWEPVKIGGKPVVVETKLRKTAATEGGKATDYLVDRVMRIPHVGLHKLGRPVGGVGVKLLLPLQVGDPTVLPLANAQGSLAIETLLEDPSRLFFELTIVWPMNLAIGQPSGDVPVNFLNTDVRKPSSFVEDVNTYLDTKVVEFLTASAK